jgi:hypothetical protein
MTIFTRAENPFSTIGSRSIIFHSSLTDLYYILGVQFEFLGYTWGYRSSCSLARIYLSPKDVRALALRIKELEKRRILEPSYMQGPNSLG